MIGESCGAGLSPRFDDVDGLADIYLLNRRTVVLFALMQFAECNDSIVVYSRLEDVKDLKVLRKFIKNSL